jgi:2,4-dienoyl-CoA reductase-like NADH-dependent reductase (Old Yellow Enzyme family)
MNDVKSLFKPFELSELQLRNRIVMPAMTRNFSPNNIPGDNVLEYYRRRAKSTGLIITEGTCVNHPAASAYPDVPFFYGEDSLAAWKRVVDAVHAEGSKIAPQLWHVGSARHPDSGPEPIIPAYTPSGLTQKLEKHCHAMSDRDIEDVIAAFAQAAADAKALGFDAVEIHGAHGYLIDEFFWEKSNCRHDNYGGSLVNRTRFASKIIRAVRLRVGSNFPIIFRFSQWKQQDYDAKLVRSPQELELFLQPLSESGVDIFHCSTRRYWEPEFGGSDLNLAGWTKKITGKPTITVGSVGLDTEIFQKGRGYSAGKPTSLDNLIKRLESEEFDLVAVGRAIIANPDWAEKVQAGDLDQLAPFSKEYLRKLH